MVVVKSVGLFLLGLLVLALVNVVGAWSLMLVVGNAHLNWWPALPLMSFSAAYSVCLPPVLIGGFFTGLAQLRD
jgi:hypothetical protein